MSSDVRWQGLDHPAIYKMINGGSGANASDAPADFWGMLSEGLKDISDNLHKKLGDLNVHWQGVSSDQALAGMNPLKEWAGNAQSGSNVMKSSFELQGNYVSDARNEVPPPKEVTTPEPSGWAIAGAVAAGIVGNPGPAAAVAGQAADHEAQERAQDEAARKAVQAMQKYEKSSDWNADTLGQFQDPPKLVVETPPPAPGLNQSSVETSGMYNNTGVHNNTTSTSSVQHTPIGSNTTTHNPTVPSSTHTPPTTTPQNYPTPPQNYPTPPQKLPLPPGNPPGMPPGNPPYGGGNQYGPWGGGPGPFPPGGGGGQQVSGGRPGIPGGGTGPGGQGQGGGRGGLGNPNAGFGQNASMADDARQGRPGMGGNPMLQEGAGRGGPGGNMGQAGRGGPGGGVPGGRAEGEEDTEHETPDYLMETDDIFGDERMIAPSVIGEKPEQ